MSRGDLVHVDQGARCGCGGDRVPFERRFCDQGPGKPEVWFWACLVCSSIEARLGVPSAEDIVRRVLLFPERPPTVVVNVRRHRYDVYIGRAGRGEDGYFGNPVVLGRRCPVCGSAHTRGDGARAVECFGVLFHEKLDRDQEYRRRVWGLAGMRLGCFCKLEPGDERPCHGDIYAAFLNRYAGRRDA